MKEKERNICVLCIRYSFTEKNKKEGKKGRKLKSTAPKHFSFLRSKTEKEGREEKYWKARQKESNIAAWKKKKREDEKWNKSKALDGGRHGRKREEENNKCKVKETKEGLERKRNSWSEREMGWMI